VIETAKPEGEARAGIKSLSLWDFDFLALKWLKGYFFGTAKDSVLQSRNKSNQNSEIRNQIAVFFTKGFIRRKPKTLPPFYNVDTRSSFSTIYNTRMKRL